MRVIERPSPNHEPRAGGRAPDMLLLHYTATVDGETAIRWLTNPKSKVSAHYLVDVDGSIVRMVDEADRAWHAGVSFWAGERDINSCSIGIEIQNPGHDTFYPDFPEPQLVALEALCRDIVSRHAIAPERVLAHSDVAPARKIDPGEKLDWGRLHRAGIGHYVEPEPIRSGPVLKLGDEGPAVRELQERLAGYGYGVPRHGLYDGETRMVVAAFQRHFRPARVDGVADSSTIVTLERLAAAAGSPHAGT